MDNIKTSYNESSIQILSGLKGVRKRPSMYIGSTDKKGLHHLIWEILDNAMDEVIAGFCNEIKVKVNKDNSITITDNGRGIPLGKHKSGMDTPELIFSKLHAGGKFGSDGYKTSGGLHGVGSSVVNALSERFHAEIARDGRICAIKFMRGDLVEKLTEIRKTKLHGTSVTFLADEKIFGKIHFSKTLIEERLKECAYLNPGLKIIFSVDKYNKIFNYDKGIESFISDINTDKPILFDTITFMGEFKGIKASVSMQYTKEYNEIILSFANNIKTTEGGTHVSGFKSAVLKAIIDYAKQEKYIKSDVKIDSNDIREGLTAIISVLVPEKDIEYEGQTKAKLSAIKARKALETITYEKFFFWLQANKKNAKELIDKILLCHRARDEAKKAKEMVRLGKSNKNKKIKLLSGKLTPAYSRKKDQCELFIVEGDSAGGSAKLGRNKEFQAILPLRGKVINVVRTSEMDILSNNEIQVIINSIGAGIGSTFDVTNSNYGKIIIMTDADNDGAHIQILLLSFFYKYMQDLFKKGMVYIATPPLYKIKNKGKNTYFWNEKKLRETVEAIKNDNYAIQRYKGLGEMNYEQLWETTMDPKTRKLIKVSLEDIYQSSETLNVLMGKETIKRKEWIVDNIDFNNDDDFLNMKNNSSKS